MAENVKPWDGKPPNPEQDGDHWVVPLDGDYDPVVVRWTAKDGWDCDYPGLEYTFCWDGWVYVQPFEVPADVWKAADAARAVAGQPSVRVAEAFLAGIQQCLNAIDGVAEDEGDDNTPEGLAVLRAMDALKENIRKRVEKRTRKP